jgi:hypothetical protein
MTFAIHSASLLVSAWVQWLLCHVVIAIHWSRLVGIDSSDIDVDGGHAVKDVDGVNV